MAHGKRILGAVIEELIGLSTMLFPEPKHEAVSFSFEGLEAESSLSNIRAMKDLLGEVRAQTTCPKCLAHCDTIEGELAELEKKVPTYERVARLRRQLRDVLDQIKREAELPLLPEEKKEEESH